MFVRSRDVIANYLEYRMLAGVSAASKHKLRLVIRIRLEIHATFYPLKNKSALKEMAAAPIEEGIFLKVRAFPDLPFNRYILSGNEYEGTSSPNLGKRVFGDIRVETYGNQYWQSPFSSCLCYCMFC